MGWRTAEPIPAPWGNSEPSRRKRDAWESGAGELKRHHPLSDFREGGKQPIVQDWLTLLGAAAAHDGEDEDQAGKIQVRQGERPVGRPEP